MMVQDLLTAAAVRGAAARMLADARAGGLQHWTLDEQALPQIATLVARITQRNYPDLKIPFHARWRHFTAGGVDRWLALAAALPEADPVERARRAFDLVIMSVLVDAGSGGAWSYFDAITKERYHSSEGLAQASLDLYRDGIRKTRGRALAAQWLAALDIGEFERAFQVRDDNPLSGTMGRVSLLNRLGRVCLARPDVFATSGIPRPGGLVDTILKHAVNGQIAADATLELVLDSLGAIWPSPVTLEGIPLGDAWIYPPWASDDGLTASAIVPFHKLSQWLTYSLIEPLEDAGITVTGIGQLTGLAEYRNGGLFVDGGALQLKRPADAALVHAPDSALVIEWRAMTVALLDLLHPLVAEELGIAFAGFPLARMLEGGTWAAGRDMARRSRTDGRPPITVVNDGTVF
ncbi:MAG: DUF1688 family protein [Rhizobiales bacterium]|nr:DUF1688 family protein [Hyphomicrobiales bacterium]MBI3674491.1 DUF1688 family protein [Hyphomicrobiales bacterium]